MKINTYTALLVSALYCFALIGVLAYGIYKIEDLGSDYESSHNTIAEQQAKEQAYFELVQIVETSADDRAELASFFVDEKDTIGFISTIERYAAERGLELETTQLAVDPKTEKSEAILNVGFTFRGTEAAVKNMTAVFETVPYHKEIPELSILERESGSWEGRIALRVTMTP